jgi:hypothetical protein
MKTCFAFSLLGLLGALFSIFYANSLPFVVQEIIKPAFVVFLAFTLPFEPEVLSGVMRSYVLNIFGELSGGLLQSPPRTTGQADSGKPGITQCRGRDLRRQFRCLNDEAPSKGVKGNQNTETSKIAGKNILSCSGVS